MITGGKSFKDIVSDNKYIDGHMYTNTRELAQLTDSDTNIKRLFNL